MESQTPLSSLQTMKSNLSQLSMGSKSSCVLLPLPFHCNCLQHQQIVIIAGHLQRPGLTMAGPPSRCKWGQRLNPSSLVRWCQIKYADLHENTLLNIIIDFQKNPPRTLPPSDSSSSSSITISINPPAHENENKKKIEPLICKKSTKDGVVAIATDSRGYSDVQGFGRGYSDG